MSCVIVDTILTVVHAASVVCNLYNILFCYRCLGVVDLSVSYLIALVGICSGNSNVWHQTSFMHW